MPDLVSYAQNFEDVMLWRALGHIKEGHYVDIGAQDPVIDSVSLLFYEHGWRGIHVEPTPSYAELLRQARPEEVVIQAAVGARSGTQSFYEFPNTGLGTGDSQIAEQHVKSGFIARELVVSSVTLDDILSSFGDGKEVHWLKIDVEGCESQALEGWKDSTLRPWIIVVESVLPLTRIESKEQWEPMLLRKGYRLAYFDGLNRFYIADGHDELFGAFSSGPNIFDGFSLSGKASAPFCTLVNTRLAGLESQYKEDRSAAEQRHADRERMLSDVINAGKADLSRLEQACDQLERELNGQLQVEREAGARLHRELTTLQNEHAALQGEHAILVNSRSWRFTAPFRAIAVWFNSIQSGLGPVDGAADSRRDKDHRNC